MELHGLAKTSDEIENTFVAFEDEGVSTGEISYLEGVREGVEAGLFRVNPGEFPDRSPVFHTFFTDEYFMVLEGSVRVEVDEEVTVHRVGDCAFYPAGHSGTWTFEAPFRKFSVEISTSGE